MLFYRRPSVQLRVRCVSVVKEIIACRKFLFTTETQSNRVSQRTAAIEIVLIKKPPEITSSGFINIVKNA
ncbi:MAG: hypothetical protein JWQ30_2692 [Sediminibacterium sp.]|nr:hypothetical protein [Sediminibacterium sp.]